MGSTAKRHGVSHGAIFTSWSGIALGAQRELDEPPDPEEAQWMNRRWTRHPLLQPQHGTCGRAVVNSENCKITPGAEILNSRVVVYQYFLRGGFALVLSSHGMKKGPAGRDLPAPHTCTSRHVRRGSSTSEHFSKLRVWAP